MSSPASILSLVASLELRLGNGFAIEGEVAKGGMSRIYSARRPDTRERIAIKVMVDRLSGASGPERLELEERFLLEMQVLQKLNHPRIPAVLSAGDVERIVVLHDAVRRRRIAPVAAQAQAITSRFATRCSSRVTSPTRSRTCTRTVSSIAT